MNALKKALFILFLLMGCNAQNRDTTSHSIVKNNDIPPQEAKTVTDSDLCARIRSWDKNSQQSFPNVAFNELLTRHPDWKDKSRTLYAPPPANASSEQVTCFWGNGVTARSAAIDTEKTTSDGNHSCSTAFPSNYKVSNIGEIYKKLATINLKKDDFETRNAYQQRIKNELGKVGLNQDNTYYFSKKLDPESVKYDADTQNISINASAVSIPSFGSLIYTLLGSGSNLHNYGIEVEHSLNNLFVVLESKEKTTGSYVGENALGVRTTVIKAKTNSYGIFDKALQHDAFSLSYDKNLKVFDFKSASDQARKIKNSSYAIFTAKLKYPYYAYAEDHKRATISSPIESITAHQYIIADMDCMALKTQQDGIIDVRNLQ